MEVNLANLILNFLNSGCTDSDCKDDILTIIPNRGQKSSVDYEFHVDLSQNIPKRSRDNVDYYFNYIRLNSEKPETDLTNLQDNSHVSYEFAIRFVQNHFSISIPLKKLYPGLIIAKDAEYITCEFNDDRAVENKQQIRNFFYNIVLQESKLNLQTRDNTDDYNFICDISELTNLSDISFGEVNVTPVQPNTDLSNNYSLLNNYLTNIKLDNSLKIATVYAEYILKGNDPYLQIHGDALIDTGVKKFSYGTNIYVDNDFVEIVDFSLNTWTFKINIGNVESIFKSQFTFTNSNNNKIPLLVYFNNNVLKLDSAGDVIGYERYDTINTGNITTSAEFSLEPSDPLPSFLDNEVYEILINIPEPDTQTRYSIIDTNPDLLTINDTTVTLNMQNQEILITNVFNLGIESIDSNLISLKVYDDTGSLHYEPPLSYDNLTGFITYNQQTTLTGQFTIEIMYNSQPVPVLYKPPLMNGYEYVFELILPSTQPNPELRYSFTEPNSLNLESYYINITQLIPDFNSEGTLITNVFNLDDSEQGYTFNPESDTVSIEFYDAYGGTFMEEPPIEVINNNFIRRTQSTSYSEFKLNINVYKDGNQEPTTYKPPLINDYDSVFELNQLSTQQNTGLRYSFTEPNSLNLESYYINITPLIPDYNSEGTLITNVFNLDDSEQGYTFNPEIDTVSIEFYDAYGGTFMEEPPIEVINNNFIRRTQSTSYSNFKLHINVYKDGNQEPTTYISALNNYDEEVSLELYPYQL